MVPTIARLSCHTFGVQFALNASSPAPTLLLRAAAAAACRGRAHKATAPWGQPSTLRLGKQRTLFLHPPELCIGTLRAAQARRTEHPPSRLLLRGVKDDTLPGAGAPLRWRGNDDSACARARVGLVFLHPDRLPCMLRSTDPALCRGCCCCRRGCACARTHACTPLCDPVLLQPCGCLRASAANGCPGLWPLALSLLCVRAGGCPSEG